MARIRKERELKRSRITVIGKGLTERWYFEHLRSMMGYRYDCKPRFFSRQSYEEMGKLIDWVLRDDGIAVCVCDADITRTNQTERQRFKEMKEKYALEERVLICDSMPSIEFWFLLHYLDTSRHFQNSDDVVNALHRWLPEFQKSGSFLEKPQWVVDLCKDNKLQVAYDRAKTIDHKANRESYSNVFKAIELFNENKGRKS